MKLCFSWPLVVLYGTRISIVINTRNAEYYHLSLIVTKIQIVTAGIEHFQEYIPEFASHRRNVSLECRNCTQWQCQLANLTPCWVVDFVSIGIRFASRHLSDLRILQTIVWATAMTYIVDQYEEHRAAYPQKRTLSACDPKNFRIPKLSGWYAHLRAPTVSECRRCVFGRRLWTTTCSNRKTGYGAADRKHMLIANCGTAHSDCNKHRFVNVGTCVACAHRLNGHVVRCVTTVFCFRWWWSTHASRVARHASLDPKCSPGALHSAWNAINCTNIANMNVLARVDARGCLVAVSSSSSNNPSHALSVDVHECVCVCLYVVCLPLIRRH